ncbi:FeoC-like transcriptional regulator [Chitinolyticbacter meiyuanensis]|uniref:FeoC-like transcriptional regulator n=1 Tax=Chitinolyticbacter meiyuanensis TaxID=682798 RepID=UPI0011E5F5F9|nr:FeoC-like transcriptional regulator [Chitinolyticbacter meiyuanensis]
MGLLELKQYLQGRGTVDTGQVALHFGVETSAVQQLAEDWAARGRLQLMQPAARCGAKRCSGCCTSPPATLLRWLE